MQTRPQFGKQLGVWMPLADYLKLREHAARQGVSMGALVKRWIKPKMEKIPPARV